MEERILVATRKYKAGYEVRTEDVLSGFEDKEEGHRLRMKSAYTLQGDYIGNPKTAYRLCNKMGINPEKANPLDGVCSIGFCGQDAKWYGWSHRAIYGFGVGEVVEDGDCAATSGFTDEYLVEHPEEDLSLPIGFKAENVEDTKRMAIAFAESVS